MAPISCEVSGYSKKTETNSVKSGRKIGDIGVAWDDNDNKVRVVRYQSEDKKEHETLKTFQLQPGEELTQEIVVRCSLGGNQPKDYLTKFIFRNI